MRVEKQLHKWALFYEGYSYLISLLLRFPLNRWKNSSLFSWQIERSNSVYSIFSYLYHTHISLTFSNCGLGYTSPLERIINSLGRTAYTIWMKRGMRRKRRSLILKLFVSTWNGYGKGSRMNMGSKCSRGR